MIKCPPVLLGMIVSAIAFVFFTAFDTTAKYVSQNYSMFQVMAVMFVTSTLLMTAYAYVKHRANTKTVLHIHKPSLHLARGVTQIAGQTLAYLALPHVSLAEFYVMIFTSPIIVVLVSAMTLKEKIAKYVWLVLVVNFIGVLVAVRPDESMNWWTLALFMGTFMLSCSLVILRKMMQTESSEIAAITTSGALMLGSVVPALFVYQEMTIHDLLLMGLGGIFFSFAQTFLTIAYRLAPTAYSSPPQFLQLIYGAIAGYLVFGDVPSMWIYVGGTIVIIANVFLIVKQQRDAAQS